MKRYGVLLFGVLAFIASGIHSAAAVDEFWPTGGQELSLSSVVSSKNKTHKSSHSSASVSSSGSSSGLSSLSGSGDMMYACVCSDLRKVSLMGASNYCLFPDAYVDNKCGNVNVAENGECPRAGAQPCSNTGHVLMSDSICTQVSGIYKCVASKADVKAQKQSATKKKTSKKTSSSSGAGNGDVIVSTSGAMRSPLEVAAFTLSVVVGAALLLQ